MENFCFFLLDLFRKTFVIFGLILFLVMDSGIKYVCWHKGTAQLFIILKIMNNSATLFHFTSHKNLLIFMRDCLHCNANNTRISIKDKFL